MRQYIFNRHKKDTSLSFETKVDLILFVQHDVSRGRNGLDRRDVSYMPLGRGLPTCVKRDIVHLFIIATCYYS